MNAPTPQSGFARTRTASDLQPTIADSYLRWVKSLPVADQIKHVQAIVEGEVWGAMDHQDGVAVDTALASFALNLDEADLAEHSRMHGPVERTTSGYWM